MTDGAPRAAADGAPNPMAAAAPHQVPDGAPAHVIDGAPQTDWRRPAARSLLVTPLRTAKELIPSLAPVVVLAISQGGQAYWLLLLLVVVPVLIAVLRWWNTGYRIAGDQFQVRHGIVRKHLLTAQLDRIRTVDEEASLLRRALHIVDLHVGTGAHEAVSVHGIDATEAAALHCGLLARRRHAQPHRPDLPHLPSEGSPEHPAYGPGAADGDFTEENTAPERTVAAFSPAWLRFAPFTMSGVATVLTAWAIGGRIVNEFQLGDTVTPWVDRLRDATAQLSLLVLVLTVLIGGLVLVSVLSVAAYSLANWGYRLTRRGDATLYVRRGLLTSRAMTIEERRLRGVVLERPLLLRIPRGARAKALVTGGKRRSEEGARATHLLVPPAPAALVRAAAGDVLGTATPLTAPLLGHGPRAVRRRHTRALLGLAPVAATVAGAAWWWHWPRGTYVVAVLVLALAPVLATLRARSLGHAVLGDPRVLLGPDAGYLVGRSGAFPQDRSCLRSRAVIGWVLRETFFQRRAGLVTLEATVATSRGKIRILDVPRARALEIVRDATPGLLDRYLEP